MKISWGGCRWLLAAGGAQKQKPRRLRRRGFEIWLLAALSEPRRRVRYYAYDYTYDDRQRYGGMGKGTGGGSHLGSVVATKN
ncbi:hypothetical protein VX159_10145 [Dechloromonas sp. ZY10]|uniref:hypothetical protein n=1 Tax=Dechloromonas aquae TaxID=2664436 RepID=UPI003528553F